MNHQQSSIIAGFEILKQRLELQREINHLVNIDLIQKQRRGQISLTTQEKMKKTKEKHIKQTDNIKDLDQHKISLEEFKQRYQLSEENLTQGLDSDDALKRNIEQGDNVLLDRVKTSWYVLYFKQITSPFALMQWIGAALCFLLYGFNQQEISNLTLGIVLIFIVFLTGTITYVQNAKSDSIMDAFKNFIPPVCKVIRDGKQLLIPATKVVTGDLVDIKMGDRIPADIRIISSDEMKVDNSSLTGESEPLIRSSQCTDPDKILETKNVAFFGTLCTNGQGKGIVFNIGENTIIGQIANLAELAQPGETPIRKEINWFVIIISIIAIFFGLLVFGVGFAIGYDFFSNIQFAIGIILAIVPEGLPITITVSLSVAAKRLSWQKVLIKNLESVETLGSTSCICSDKTGTLTQNLMTVENIWINDQILKGENKEVQGKDFEYQYKEDDYCFQELYKCAVLNSTATFNVAIPQQRLEEIEDLKKDEPEEYQRQLEIIQKHWQEELKTTPYYKWQMIGDASETALMKFFQPIKDIEQFRKDFLQGLQFDNSPAVIPFNSSYKYALTINKLENNSEYNFVAWIKGAPENIWQMCGFLLVKNEHKQINEYFQKKFEQANKQFASQGERVLGFASLYLKKDQYPQEFKFDLKNPLELPFGYKSFCFIGAVSLIDLPKIDVPDAIKKCQTAGVKIIMVTGDQQLTAASIAWKIGIFSEKSSIDYIEEGFSEAEAIKKADAIVINGEMLTRAALEDEGKPESLKGKQLEQWLLKPQIVFARTSPAQKLYIVKGCQKLGYVVAVTGDGVNDSPAIKQADLGIAMGLTGSDVAKDAADMILLDDSFAGIIIGIEEGRKIFDNIKKSIMYNISSNIPELVPYLTIIILMIPLPLSTFLIICISLGTDIFPSLAFAFEEAELDIMTRKPRSQNEHLVTGKLLQFSYLQTGIILAFGIFVTYFVMFYDFGFYPSSLFYLTPKVYFPHNPTDIYDQASLTLGNSNVHCVNGEFQLINWENRKINRKDNQIGTQLDWLYISDYQQDVRMGFLKGNCNNNTIVTVQQQFEFAPCRFKQISRISNRPICYSTEALKYIQTACFFTIVLIQISNSNSTRTRIISIFNHGISNIYMIMAWAFQLVLMVTLSFIAFINIGLGTRDLYFIHFGLYAAIFSLFMFAFFEIRKLIIRKFPKKQKGKNWAQKNLLI